MRFHAGYTGRDFLTDACAMLDALLEGCDDDDNTTTERGA